MGSQATCLPNASFAQFVKSILDQSATSCGNLFKTRSTWKYLHSVAKYCNFYFKYIDRLIIWLGYKIQTLNPMFIVCKYFCLVCCPLVTWSFV